MKNQKLSEFQTQNGSSLIAMAIMIVIVGSVLSAFINIYQNQTTLEKDQETVEKNQVITSAINDFVMRNGRYPCPAPLNVPRDNIDFGVEDGLACTNPAYHGAHIAAFGISTAPTLAAPRGPVGGPFVNIGSIKIGAIPVRSLNISDDYMFDGYGHRYVYAVTENMATAGVDTNADLGGIDLRDANNNSVTAPAHQVKYIFFSAGADQRGAWDKEGNIVLPCVDTPNPADAGENCDYQLGPADPTFISSFFKTAI